ncbi:MAG: hypothetical protein JWN32_1904 [Solirubrobacterales bacterium]|nr:hypothetical protein [Solirubrobacterales bacterium]
MALAAERSSLEALEAWVVLLASPLTCCGMPSGAAAVAPSKGLLLDQPQAGVRHWSALRTTFTRGGVEPS